MINTLCHMVFQCQTHLTSSVAMLINHVFFYVGFSTKACHRFGRPQIWALSIYICVGTSLIGWLDDTHTLPYGFSVPDMSNNNKQYGQVTQPWVFPCWLLNQGMTWVWMTSNMETKEIYLCWNKFYWVACR